MVKMIAMSSQIYLIVETYRTKILGIDKIWPFLVDIIGIKVYTSSLNYSSRLGAIVVWVCRVFLLGSILFADTKNNKNENKR